MSKEKAIISEETIKSPFKSEINIGCRGVKCKEKYQFINEIPLQVTCGCGFVIIKDGVIYPSKENK